MEEHKERYIVREKIAEAPGVVTLKLSLCDGTTPPYTPGQCITVYFPECGTPEGKAYSISSAPWEDALHITVKARGEFSNRLCAMSPGDRITASKPFGYFYSESDTNPLVMLAGGTGIMPFRSMILDAIKRDPRRKLALFYSVRTRAEILFGNTFDDLRTLHDNLMVRYFITREERPQRPSAHETCGRMNPDTILDSIPETPEPEFLICGSISFVRDLWRDLRDKGVPEEALYTEAFFS